MDIKELSEIMFKDFPDCVDVHQLGQMLGIPIFTPFTKYFCRNGYRIMNGMIAIMIDAFASVDVLISVEGGRSPLPIILFNCCWKVYSEGFMM